MSDPTSIPERIREALKELEEAHKATEELEAETNHANFDAFMARMAEPQ